MKLDLPAVDRLAETIRDVADETRHGPSAVVIHRHVHETDALLLFALTLIGVGLCGIGAAMLEGGRRGKR